MNVNYLNFLEIGNCSSEFAINHRAQDDIYGFCLEENEQNFKNLKVKANVNKLYCSLIETINLDTLIETYNIIAIDYLRIDSNSNYAIMDQFINSTKRLMIDKIELGEHFDRVHFERILFKLINSNYSLIYNKEKSFFVSNPSIPRLILKPNYLDNIFISNIKKLENI